MIRARAAAVLFILSRFLLADTVILRNSDRITGDIVKLEDKKLHVKTAYAGTILIEWSMVEQVSADRDLLVETDTGRLTEGRIQPGPTGLQIGTVTLSPLAVIRIGAPSNTKDSFFQRFSGSADAGYSLTGGNAKSTLYTLGVKSRFRARRIQLQTDAASLFSNDSDKSVNRHTAAVRGDYSLNSRSFAFTLANFEFDQRQQLDLRTNLGGGFGYKILRDERSELSVLGGSTYVREDFFTRTSTSGEALTGFSLDRMRIGRVSLTTKLSLFPNLVETGRLRLTLDGGISVPVVGRMNYNLRWFNRFDSRPQQTVQRNDYGIVSTFGVGF